MFTVVNDISTNCQSSLWWNSIVVKNQNGFIQYKPLVDILPIFILKFIWHIFANKIEFAHKKII